MDREAQRNPCFQSLGVPLIRQDRLEQESNLAPPQNCLRFLPAVFHVSLLPNEDHVSLTEQDTGDH